MGRRSPDWYFISGGVFLNSRFATDLLILVVSLAALSPQLPMLGNASHLIDTSFPVRTVV